MADEKPDKVEFTFIKGNQFRVIHVDGVWGGIGPTQYVNMAIFNQRRAIPQQIAHALVGDELGDEIAAARQGKTSVVREIEANLVMDIPTAASVAKWLQDKVDEAVNAGLVQRVPSDPTPSKK